MIKKYNDMKNISNKLITDARKKRNMTRQQLSERLELLGVYINKDELYRMEQNQLMIKDFELTAIFVILDIDLNILKKMF